MAVTARCAYAGGAPDGGSAARYGCDMSSFIPDGEPGLGHDEQKPAAEITPQEFANIEAAEELNRERWHDRLGKIFRRRRSNDQAPS
jgi:hypothetical protein